MNGTPLTHGQIRKPTVSTVEFVREIENANNEQQGRKQMDCDHPRWRVLLWIWKRTAECQECGEDVTDLYFVTEESCFPRRWVAV